MQNVSKYPQGYIKLSLTGLPEKNKRPRSIPCIITSK